MSSADLEEMTLLFWNTTQIQPDFQVAVEYYMREGVRPDRLVGQTCDCTDQAYCSELVGKLGRKPHNKRKGCVVFQKGRGGVARAEKRISEREGGYLRELRCGAEGGRKCRAAAFKCETGSKRERKSPDPSTREVRFTYSLQYNNRGPAPIHGWESETPSALMTGAGGPCAFCRGPLLG